MSNYKDELCSRYANGSFVVRDDGEAREMRTYHLRALEMVTELEAKISELETSLETWKQSWAHSCGETNELRTKLESKNKTLTLVVQALAETIGEEER